MDQPQKILDEFAVPTAAEWRQEVDRLLKGASFEQKMLTRTGEGVTISPLYSSQDTKDIPWLNSLPGQAPYVRGVTAAGHAGRPWLVAQEQKFTSALEFQNAITAALKSGQTSVLMTIQPDEYVLADLAEWEGAFDGVDLENVPLQIFAGAHALPVAATMFRVANNKGQSWSKISGCIGGDLYAELARKGTLPSSLEASFYHLATLTEHAMSGAPNLRTLLVEESPWHEGGADLALSLGLTLSSAVGMLREMDSRGLPPVSVAPLFQFNVEIGTDFFMEMAKLRALRLLWSRVLVASGVAAEKARTFVHATTARRDHSSLAPHVNMLRATTEAMSAIMGGTNSLSVRSFDGDDSQLGLRVARNVQLVLAQECGLGQVADPAGGAWYVECLTRDLAQNAWSEFQKIEAAGGIAAALESHVVQESVNTSALAKSKAVATRRHVIVGVNKYPDPAVAVVKIPEPDVPNSEPTSKRFVAADLASKNMADVQKAIAGGADIGSIMVALHDDDEENEVVDPIPLWRAAEPFEKLHARVQVLGAAHGAVSRVVLVCLGDVAAYGPR
ncbi:MAG: methylmalonyl-CoA mutase, partial [Candidatus Krumholzibacteriia bacterium]